MSRARSLSADWFHLADGRRLVYTATGPADGVPVLYCHGAIGTPVGANVDLERLTARVGVRYIAVMRPGVGGSDPAPGRTILSFADDVRELADALELERFSVLGVSAGGPYALALSHRLGHRVRRIAVISSLSPLCAPARTPGLRKRIRLSLGLLDRAPWIARGVGNALLPLLAASPRLIDRVITAAADPTARGRLGTLSQHASAAQSFVDACAGGVGGLLEDYRIYTAAWDFDPGQVDSPVDVWHGARDPLVPLQHALALGATLPQSRMFIDADEGHHFFRSNLESILETLVERVVDFRLRRAEPAVPGAPAALLPTVPTAPRRAAA